MSPERSLSVVVLATGALIGPMAVKAFQSEGFDAYASGSVRKGLPLIDEHKPVVVFLDVKLPDMPGTRLARAIKAEKALATTAVILITQLTDADLDEQLKETGADGYIHKPFGAKDLHDWMEANMEPIAERLEAKRKKLAESSAG